MTSIMGFLRQYADYRHYVNDEQSFYKPNIIRFIIKDDFYYIASYIKAMRYIAFWGRYNGVIPVIIRYWYICRLNKLRRKTNLEIHPHSCSWGIKIWHCGNIIINDKAKVGRNLTIYPGCVIGQTEEGDVPILGDNVFMGAGSKVFGKIKIGDNVMVAPNAVVTHDVPSNTVVAGIPASIIGKYKKYKWQ